MNKDLRVEVKDDVATLTLNRPQTQNAITIAMYQNLRSVLLGLDDDPDVKVVVLRGAGRRSFTSGADISEFERERGNACAARSYNERVAGAERALEELGKPTIAMIHGYCIGGGAGLALACDLRFADTRASFAVTPAKIGLVYSLESTKRLVHAVGPSRTKWILMSGLQIDAERGMRLRLFDEVTEPDQLEEFTYSFAEIVTARAQHSVKMAKEMVRRVVAGQVTENAETIELRNASFDTEDYAEGVRAFLEKRRPVFQ